MKPQQQPISVHERHLGRIFLAGTSAFLVLGYVLYFTARSGTPPDWALTLIDALKPTLGALNTAARVSGAPFPAQAVIVYCAFGSIVLTAWFAYWFLLANESRVAIQQKMISQPRMKLAILGLGNLMLMLPGWAWFLAREDTDIGWRDVAMFSPSFGSATVQLLGGVTMASLTPLALYALWTALTWPPALREQSINSPKF